MDRISWPFASPNLFGLFCAIGLLVLQDIWPRVQSRPLRGICEFAAITLAMLLIGSGSRGAILSYAVGAVLLATARGFKKKYVVSALIGTFLLMTVSGFLSTRILASEAGIGVSQRLEVWRAALAAIGDHPWTGLGVDGWAEANYLWYMPGIEPGRFFTPLSDSLQIAAAWGLPALGGVLALVLFLSVAAWRTVRIPAAKVTVAILATIVVAGLFQCHWYHLSWVGLIAVVLLLLVLSIDFRKGQILKTSALLATTGSIVATLTVGALAMRCAQDAVNTTIRIGSVWYGWARSSDPIANLMVMRQGSRRHNSQESEWIGKMPAFRIGLSNRLNGIDALNAFATEHQERWGVIAFGEEGMEVWNQWNASSHPGTGRFILIDPSDIPESGKNVIKDLVVIRRKGSAFVPRAEELRESLGNHGGFLEIDQNSDLKDVLMRLFWK